MIADEHCALLQLCGSDQPLVLEPHGDRGSAGALGEIDATIERPDRDGGCRGDGDLAEQARQWAAAVNSETGGVVSERDVLKKIVAAGRDPDRTLIREIMTSPVITVGARTTVPEAAELMRKHHIRHLVVVDDDGRLVGMLALRYLLYDMMNDMQRDVSDLLGYIMLDGPGG
mgnify:CR=1 FL=1